jgi:hypothetical protein
MIKGLLYKQICIGKAKLSSVLFKSLKKIYKTHSAGAR